MYTKKSCGIFCLLNVLLLTSLSSVALTPQEDKLMELAQKACANYFSPENLKLTVKEIQGRTQKREAVISKVMKYALSANNLKSEQSLLCKMLLSKELQFHAWNYIIKHKNNIAKEKYTPIIYWRLYSLNKFQPARNSIIKGTIINFDNIEYYDQESLSLLKKIILTDTNVNILYILFLRKSIDNIKKQLISISQNASNYTLRKSFWRRSWLGACLLAKIYDASRTDNILEVATKLLQKSKKQSILIYVPLGLALSEEKKSIELLFDLLKSNVKHWNGKDCEPQETQLAHEVACALSLVVENFPKYKPYQNFTKLDKKRCLEWVEKHRNNYEITKHPLSFYLKHTRLGL